MKLRVLGPAAVTAAAVLLPLAAFAGAADAPRTPGGRTAAAAPSTDAVPPAGGAARSGAEGAARSVAGRPAAGLPGEGPDAARAHGRAGAAADGTGGGAPFPARPIERCGPELASPAGVEAQTCVMAEAGETWARTYYRNPTSVELTAVLSLMAPGGRAWQANCLPHEGDEPGLCETPRALSLGEPSAYAAVAEFAADGDGGHGPLLLRADSNSVAAEGR